MGRREKHKKAPQRIEPHSPAAVAPKPKASVTPKVTLAEFGHAPAFILQKSDKSDAPRVSGYSCTGAWDIVHPDEKKAMFAQVVEELGNVQTLFHGTPARNITRIAEEGLRPGGRYCMFGSGIYMGGIEKAFGFAHGVNARYVFKVKAALGIILNAPQSHKYTLRSVQDAGCHSVGGLAGYTASWGGTLRHSEYVVYSPDQVIALKVYEFQSDFEEIPYYRRQPSYGTCPVLVSNSAPLPPGSKAFKDILTQKACGKTAHTRLHTDHQDIWVCNDCIARLRIKIGSKVPVRSKGLNLTYRIRGKYEG